MSYELRQPEYDSPETPHVVERTYDLGKDGSKWAHGYIPLNAAAVALKNHKQPGAGSGGTSTKVGKGKSRTTMLKLAPMSRTKVAGAKGRAPTPSEPMKRLTLDHPNVLGSDWKRLTSDDPKVRKAARADAAAKASTPHESAVKSSHPIGSPVLAKQPGIETETRGHITGHTDSGMVKVQYTDRKGGQTIGTFNPAHTRVLSGQEAAQHDFEHGGPTARPGLNPATIHNNGTPIGKAPVDYSAPRSDPNNPLARAKAAGDSARAKRASRAADGMSAKDHLHLAIEHNDKAVAALDAGDRATADLHANAAREHNAASLKAATADEIVKLRAAAKPGPAKQAVDAEIARRIGAKVQVYNVQTGKTEHVSPEEAAAGHARYGQSLGAGSPAAGQTVKNALEAERARRGSTITTPRGVIAQTRHVDISGTPANGTDYRSMTPAQKMAAAEAMHGSDRTRWKAVDLKSAAAAGDDAARTELARRAAKKASPPKAKQHSAGLPLKAGRSDRAAPGTHSIGGVKMTSDVNSNRSPAETEAELRRRTDRLSPSRRRAAYRSPGKA